MLAQFVEDRPLCLMGMCHFSLDLLEIASCCERRRSLALPEIVGEAGLPALVPPGGPPFGEKRGLIGVTAKGRVGLYLPTVSRLGAIASDKLSGERDV
jgi:hypothetical protein